MSPYDRRIKTEAAPQDFRRGMLTQRIARPKRHWAATRIASPYSSSAQQTDTTVGDSEVIDLADFDKLEAKRLRSKTPFPDANAEDASLNDDIDHPLSGHSPDKDYSERANTGDELFNTSPPRNPTTESANTIDELLLLHKSSPRGNATSESTNTNDSRSTASIASSEGVVDVQGPPYYRITIITNGPPERGILHKPKYVSPTALEFYAAQLRLRRARLALTRDWIAKYGNSELPSFEQYAAYAKSTNETQVREAHELARESQNARRSRIIRFDRGPPCFQRVNWDHERFWPAYPSPVKHSVTMEEWDMVRQAENGWMLWIGNAELAAYSNVEDAWD